LRPLVLYSRTSPALLEFIQMNDRRNVIVTMFAISIAVHLFLSVVWSANRLYSVQNSADPPRQVFTVVITELISHVNEPQSAIQTSNPALSKTEPDKITSDESTTPRAVTSAMPASGHKSEQSAVTTDNARPPIGPFQSTIDRKKAWINVAESVNYDLLRGISMDISQGEYRLPDELDTRVRAKGDLTIEYPLIAAALGKEAAVYVLLLIDEQGQKLRVQIVRGDPDFDNAVLQSLEKIEFRPAMLKRVPVRSLLLLEFEFRRDPPEIGSL
jgi:TonB family protein